MTDQERIPSTDGWLHISTMSDEEAAFDRDLREAEAESEVVIRLTREQAEFLRDHAHWQTGILDALWDPMMPESLFEASLKHRQVWDAIAAQLRAQAAGEGGGGVGERCKSVS